MTGRQIEAATEAVLDALACRPTPKNYETARRVAVAVLSAVDQLEPEPPAEARS